MPCFLFQASQEQRQHPASPRLQSAHGMAKEAGAAQTDIPRGKSRDAGSVGRPVEKRPVPDWQAGARPHLQQYPPQGCIPGQMPQCAASAVAGRCIAQRSALRFPAEKTAVRGAAWQVGLHASLSTCREFLPPGRTVQSAFLLFPLGTQAGPAFPSSAKAEARHMRWHGLASWVFSAGQSGCLCGVWGRVRVP